MDEVKSQSYFNVLLMMLLLGKIWQVLSLKLRGLGLLMGSVTKASFRLMEKRRDKSSMYFRCNERGLGTAGQRIVGFPTDVC